VAFPLFEANVGPIKIVEHFGSEELKKALIPKVCAGEAVVGIAMSEPQAGIRLFRLVFSWDLFLKMLWRFFLQAPP